ncbi:NUDIX domain-containing protein [Nonlabens sp. Hel1_33_55]|uniref:NUDIX hydrolase n=1 Tax=Nonlabens sp. Hel1_33_55 TaxID=1336802 RepID=UPI000875BFF0|nr:CoA pyrophosphatase [Nonlabens sp. Hel1_33_55]SCY12512.1 NUDIX domain-containing protein [Nonlabens sp. Hel1_33_55]
MPLPGATAQMEMAAMERLEELQRAQMANKTPREASTMMLIYPKNEVPYFVLIERMLSKGKHSGQIAFPGGRSEEEDDSHAITALRETEEEVGILMGDQEVITAGTPVYIPPSNYLVRPFLAFAKANLSFTPQPSEVKSIIEVPLQQLLDPANVTTYNLSTSYMTDVDVPCFLLKEQIVWGATAMMLNEFKTLFTNAIDR